MRKKIVTGLMTVVTSVGVSATAGATGYYVTTLAQTSVTSSSFTNTSEYNYLGYLTASQAGASFPSPPVATGYSATQDGTQGTDPLLTSSWDTTTSSWNPALIDYPTLPVQTQSASATSNLVTGEIQGSTHSSPGYSYGRSQSGMGETLTFTVAGATASTVTPIEFKWSLSGTWDNPSPGGSDGYGIEVYSEFRVASAWTRVNTTENMSGMGINNPIIFLGSPSTSRDACTNGSGQAGWVSTSCTSSITNTGMNVEFSGILNILGASFTLPISQALYIESASGKGNIDIDPTIGLVLPDNVTFTSASGVFLTSPANPVPEPATMLLFGAGIAGLAAVGRRKIS